MVSLFSQMNEPQEKEFCEGIFKAGVLLGRKCAFHLCREDLPCDGGLRLTEFIERENLALVVAKKLSYKSEVTVGKIFQEFVNLLESLI